MSLFSTEITVPFSEIPANSPLLREYERISALIDASVEAAASRPTGPAATEASPPSSTLLFNNFFNPSVFINSRTTSVEEPPACRPTLPPFNSKKAGADHPEEVRQLDTPLPAFAPTMKPPLITDGNTATHSALFRRSVGIPLSGVPIISPRTFADFEDWRAPSLVLFPRGKGGSTGAVDAGVFGVDFGLDF